ncbi:hypothetical protein CHUAL_006805 [Chamberlinius hualienensis]
MQLVMASSTALKTVFAFIAIWQFTINFSLANDDIRLLLAKKPFDFIIVGGGSAGSTIAGRLAEIPSFNILLIEAGGPPPAESEIPARFLANTPYDWQFQTVPQNTSCFGFPDKKCNYTQGKVLGGSSTINDMMYIRGNHKDYDNWASMGNTGWEWKNVLEYFLKAEGNRIPWVANDTTYHSSKGPLTVSEAPYQTKALPLFLESAAAMGHPLTDVNGKSQLGFMPTAFTMRDGSRCSTYKAYLQSPKINLKIITDSYVTKILFDSNKKAIGVTYDFKGTLYNVTSTKEVIISAGVLQSPKILMLSGIGPEDHLKEFNIPVIANLPGVGSHFVDHVGSAVTQWSSNAFPTITQADLNSMLNYAQWQLFKTGPLTVSFQIEGTGYMSTPFNQDTDWPDAQFFLVSTSNGFLQPAFTAVGNFMIVSYLIHPKSVGTVRLQSADPADSPLINPNYFDHVDDRKVLAAATKLAFTLGNSDVFKKYNFTFNSKPVGGCDKVDFQSEEYWGCAFQTVTFPGLHGTGTCKMGVENDTMAVVEPIGLKVYKVKGLRVIDASIMPYVVSGNTNAPTNMIAEKTADAIKKDYGF